jgi:hypothetical protein
MQIPHFVRNDHVLRRREKCRSLTAFGMTVFNQKLGDRVGHSFVFAVLYLLSYFVLTFLILGGGT